MPVLLILAFPLCPWIVASVINAAFVVAVVDVVDDVAELESIAVHVVAVDEVLVALVMQQDVSKVDEVVDEVVDEEVDGMENVGILTEARLPLHPSQVGRYLQEQLGN